MHTDHREQRIMLVGLGLCAVTVSLAAGKRCGWVGYVLGPVGFLGGLVALGFVMLLLAWVAQALSRWGPEFPPCRTGRCRGGRWWRDDRGDYEPAGWDGHHRDSVFRCRCGGEYVVTDRGRRFQELLPDGSYRPYMVHRPYHGWVPDR